MLIVDAQIHVWGADSPERPWPPGGAARAQRPYPVTKDLVLQAMDEAGVGRAILVPPSWEGDRNDLALQAAQQHPDRFAVMGRFPLDRPEARSQVAGWKAQPGMLGMRFTFHTPDTRPLLSDGSIEWLWTVAEEHHIPLMIHVPGSVRAVAAIAAAHPGLRLTIDHLGLASDKKDAAAFVELPDLLKLAKHANLAVKSSALPCSTTDPYPFRNLHGYIQQVYDAFGPRRMFWGSDWSRLPVPYRQAISLFTEELPWLSTDDKELIMGRAVCDWLGWAY